MVLICPLSALLAAFPCGTRSPLRLSPLPSPRSCSQPGSLHPAALLLRLAPTRSAGGRRQPGSTGQKWRSHPACPLPEVLPLPWSWLIKNGEGCPEAASGSQTSPLQRTGGGVLGGLEVVTGGAGERLLMPAPIAPLRNYLSQSSGEGQPCSQKVMWLSCWLVCHFEQLLSDIVMTNPVLTAWNRLQEPCDDYLRHRWV